ncbi:MAG: PorP/SprF family type IX secretion system membrane protein [Bacteroidales bacterium]|nr:PorP/SprF family type IX secretion system membrane protein [Bacteroidales bacterium]
MKKAIIVLISIFVKGLVLGQQMPVSDNYFMEKSTLSSSYTGHSDPGSFFTSFRSDWTGIVGGPRTLRLFYSDLITTNAGIGGKIIYDKSGIFNQIYFMGTYSYKLKITEKHKVLMALSAGFYHNRLNFTDYYDDPKYNIDPVMISQDIPSKLKFMTDFSALYNYEGFYAGIMFANINFGDMKYSEVDVSYKPLANYLIHASYSIPVNQRWDISPLIYLRGGKYIRNQIGVAAMMRYQKNIYISLSFRDPGIWGFGFGTNISRGIRLYYTFNISSTISARVYNNHEISLGIGIKELIKKPLPVDAVE